MIDLTNLSLRTSNILHSIHSSSISDIESNDIEASTNNGINSVRIEDTTLLDTIKNDRSLMTLFMLSGFYINDDKDQLATKILGRTWQIALLVLGCIGFCMQVFIVGPNILTHYIYISKVDSNAIRFIISELFYTIIVPILQAGSLMHGIHSIRRQLHKSVNSTITSSIISSSRRKCITFFIIMSLLVVICNPLHINRAIYETEFVLVNYSEFVLQQVTLLFFNLATTCYLTVVMFFTSVTLKQIKLLQHDMLTAIDNDKLTCSEYQVEKEKINDLKNDSYLSIQILTATAAINVISFMMQVGVYYSSIYKSYKDMIVADLHTVPYIFKEIVFFYYILLLVASVNTNSSNLVYKLNVKCWQLKNENKDILGDYVLMHVDAHSYPTEMRLGPFQVRRGRVLLTLVTLVVYCVYILISFHKTT